MARTKAIEINVDAAAEAPPEEAGGEGSASLFDASGDARVRILRRDEKSQKMVTHGYMEPTVSEEMVSATFGGGHYRAQLWVPDASGSPKVKRQRDFYIPGPYKPPAHINTLEDVGPNAPIRKNGADAPAVATIPGGGDDLMQVLKAGIINTLLEMMKSTKEMRGAPAGPDPMLLKLMETQAATQTKMMEFMLTLATKDNGSDRKEIVKEMLQMKELFAPPANNGAVPTNPMEMFNNMLDTFKSFREAAEDVAPKAASGDPLMDSIPKLVEVVAEQHALNKQNAARTAAPRPTPTPTVQTLPMPDLPVWKQLLRQQGNRLVASAVAAHDPDVIAGTAILFAPAHIKAALAEFFHREEAEVAADVLVEVPAMAQHTTWLTEFINAAQYRLFPEEFSEDDDAETAKEGAEGEAAE